MTSKYVNNFNSSVGNVLQGDQSTINIQSQQIIDTFKDFTSEEIAQIKNLHTENPKILNKLSQKILEGGLAFTAKLCAELIQGYVG